MIKLYYWAFIVGTVFSTQGIADVNLGKIVTTKYGPCVVHIKLSCYDESLQNVRWQKPDFSDALFITENNNTLIVAFYKHIIALNTLTSKTLWQSDLNLEAGESLFEPVMDGQAIYITTSHGALHKLATNTGFPIWQKQPSESWIYPPASQAQIIVIGGQEHLVRGINKTSGDVTWNMQLQSELVYRPVALSDQSIIFSTFARDLYKIDSHSGKQIWHTVLPSPAIYLQAYEDRLLVGDYSGSASLLSTDSGQTLWREDVSQSPIYWFNKNATSIVFTNDSGQSTVLSLEDGKALQKNHVNQSLNSAALFNKDTLVFFPTNTSKLAPQPKPIRVALAPQGKHYESFD